MGVGIGVLGFRILGLRAFTVHSLEFRVQDFGADCSKFRAHRVLGWLYTFDTKKQYRRKESTPAHVYRKFALKSVSFGACLGSQIFLLGGLRLWCRWDSRPQVFSFQFGCW